MKQILKYSIVVCVCFFCSNVSFSQSDVLLRSYFIDPAIYNPSLESHSDHAKAILNYRRQWMGMENAPSHEYLSLTAPLMKKTLGLGFRMLNEHHGLTSRMTIASNFAYKLSLSDYQRLSFGASLGLMRQSIDYAQANVKDLDDVYVYDNSLNMTAMDMNFGVSYLYKTLEVGISLPNVFAAPYRSVKESEPAPYALDRQFISHFSYDFSVMNSKLYFKPHVLYKLGFGDKNDVQIGLITDWQHKYWFGLTHHAGNAFSTQAGMKLYEKVELAYSYDYPLTDISAVSNTSHEITLVYHFNKPHQPNPIPAGGVNQLTEVYEKLNAQQVEIMDIKKEVSEQKEVTEQIRKELNIAFGRITDLEQYRKDMDSVLNDPGSKLEDLINAVEGESKEEVDSENNSTEGNGSSNKGSNSNKEINEANENQYADTRIQGKQTHGPSSVKGIYVIAASLKSLVNCRPMINNLRRDGHNPFIIKNPSNGWYYIILGVYDNMFNAKTQLNLILNKGYSKAWIHVYE